MADDMTKLEQRDSTIQAVLQNLVEAGVIGKDEKRLLAELQDRLEGLDWKDLLVNLLESHQLAEYSDRPVKWYPVGNISVN